MFLRMPSYLHEGLVELFRNRPELAAGYLAEVFGIRLPPFRDIRSEPCDFTDIGPKEFRGDTAFSLVNGAGEAVAGIVVEVQLCRDESRRWAWPVYAATLRSRLRCPVFLLVVSPIPEIAEWSRLGIPMGHPGWVLRPLVLGPDGIPPVTEADSAIEVPERAVLSAIAHAEGPQADRVLFALLEGLRRADDERAKMYYDVVHAALSAAARTHLEVLMSTAYEYQSDFARKYIAEGRTEGRAEGEAMAVLTVLEARGIPVSVEVRDRVLTCVDTARLEEWLRRAVTVTTAEELFG
ncbi:hypothetical protein [Nocardia otitidiscaviarum]|uniref:hypothetical protein n=1 Tax=Nocardia otitidiscaviarum TaxID=1823 RepID=UPI001895D74E|nr:hypothetical protein [Nocardia otitidiscaviarum]MBF6180771.1 hypothetical protein [Nocardia otitidiscaviarum]